MIARKARVDDRRDSKSERRCRCHNECRPRRELAGAAAFALQAGPTHGCDERCDGYCRIVRDDNVPARGAPISEEHAGHTPQRCNEPFDCGCGQISWEL